MTPLHFSSPIALQARICWLNMQFKQFNIVCVLTFCACVHIAIQHQRSTQRQSISTFKKVVRHALVTWNNKSLMIYPIIIYRHRGANQSSYYSLSAEHHRRLLLNWQMLSIRYDLNGDPTPTYHVQGRHFNRWAIGRVAMKR